MHRIHVDRAALRWAAAIFLCSIALGQEGASSAQAASFDGKWFTKMTCPAKGNTEGYTWEFPAAIANGNFHGEHGTAGEPGYLLVEGKVAPDGTARLSATGIVASRKYARGVLTHKGEDYSYNIKAQFSGAQGTGIRDVGRGIIGRPCTFEFTRQ